MRADEVVQRLPVRIVLTELPSDLPLRAGLSAEVTLDVRVTSGAAPIPRATGSVAQ
jgi:multidrug resistance efflux pump